MLPTEGGTVAVAGTGEDALPPHPARASSATRRRQVNEGSNLEHVLIVLNRCQAFELGAPAPVV